MLIRVEQVGIAMSSLSASHLQTMSDVVNLHIQGVEDAWTYIPGRCFLMFPHPWCEEQACTKDDMTMLLSGKKQALHWEREVTQDGRGLFDLKCRAESNASGISPLKGFRAHGGIALRIRESTCPKMYSMRSLKSKKSYHNDTKASAVSVFIPCNATYQKEPCHFDEMKNTFRSKRRIAVSRHLLSCDLLRLVRALDGSLITACLVLIGRLWGENVWRFAFISSNARNVKLLTLAMTKASQL